MRATLLLFSCAILAASTSACQPMEPSDNPFQPVAAESPAPPAGTPPPAVSGSEEQDHFAITSDEMQAGARQTGEPAAPSQASPETQPSTADTDPVPEEPAESAGDSGAAAVPVEGLAVESPSPPAPAATQVFQDWPLRLVATVPQAQPPRAILGLPDGTEHVVTPGSMMPEARVVVISVGEQIVNLARVLPAGDHATIRTLVLHAER